MEEGPVKPGQGTRTRRRAPMRTLLSLVLVGGLASAAHALPGDLDASFSGDGRAGGPISAGRSAR
jgi:hypothetical protein